VVDFRRLDRALKDMGFVQVRQKGSHVFYRHSDGRTTTAPNHPGRDIARPLLRTILREIEVTLEDFEKLL
jgi:predicted RNA binding protein YcfA (HicA-like mRNA interferase family)